MKKLFLLFFALVSATSLIAQKRIILDGRIANCPDKTRSFIQKVWFNPETLEEENITTGFKIQEDGSFHVEVSPADDYYLRYWLYLGNEQTHLDLIAGDSLYMTLNAQLFDETIAFTGKGAGRNNYQRDDFLEFWEKNSVSRLQIIRNPDEFVDSLNVWSKKKLGLLEKYYSSREIDSDYYHFEKATILNFIAEQIIEHNNQYHNHRNLSENTSKEIDKILGNASFKDDVYLPFSQFRTLLVELPRYLNENRLYYTAIDLVKEIEYARSHYTPLMNLYFNKGLITKYLNSSRSVTESHALINFFEKHFDDPMLKRALKQQKDRSSVNQIVNSYLFRNLVLIIFLFLVALGLTYLIVLIIQHSNRNGVKFNLSLWLKVGFYVIASIVALIFLEEARDIAAVVLFFLLLVTFLIHTYFIIPQYAFKNRLATYVLPVLIEFLAFIVPLFIFLGELSSPYLILVFSEIFLGMVLLSWISYYVHQMASGKSNLRNLRKSGFLNLELAIHLVVFFLVNLAFVANSRLSGISEEAIVFYPAVFLFYFHTFFVYPRFLRKDKLAWLFGINIGILLVAAVVTTSYDLIQSHETLKNLGIAINVTELIRTGNIRFDLLVVFLLILIPSFAYYFVRKQLIKNESAGYSLYRKKEAELAQLKAQVNPHFLFNTLNTLFAFALKEGSEKTAECIAKLANLMRFMLDDMEKETILLEREVGYIQDYVKLQSIRSAVEHDIAINVAIEEGKSYSIAPMLFIPFVENAFKHGINPNKQSHLKIDITGKGNRVQFVVENSIDNSFEAYYKEKGFGIGIENVKSRLKFIYPNRHNISIAKTNEKFIVILSIDIL